MPMTQKAEPELVTSGPYRFVRHPIYSGLLAGVLGTALATNLIGLIIAALLVRLLLLLRMGRGEEPHRNISHRVSGVPKRRPRCWFPSFSARQRRASRRHQPGDELGRPCTGGTWPPRGIPARSG